MTDKNIQFGIQINADVAGTDEVKTLAQEINRTEAEVKQLKAAAETKTTLSLDTDSKAHEEIKQTEAEVKQLQAVAEAKTTLGLDTDSKAREEINKIRQSYELLKKEGGLSHQELARAADLQRDKVQRLESQLQNLRPSLHDVVNEFQNIATKTSGFAYITAEAMKFETAMAQVKKVTDGTPQQIDALSDSLKEMAGQLGMMPDELANIAAAGGQMGVAFDKLPQFTQTTAQMANAFGITADAAAEMSAKIANVYGLSIEQVAELGDAINTLGNTTAAKEVEIGNVLMRIGGNAKQFGLVKEEAAALGAAFVSLGKSPEEAGTAINALLSKLQTSTQQGTEFKNALKEIGLSAEEMAANIAANPQAALTDFLQRIAQLDTQARSVALSKLFGSEYSDDLALLTGGLKTYEAALASATNRTQTFGAMQKEAGAALDTTEGKMKQAKAEISAAAIELGRALLPVVQATASTLGGMANALKSVTEQFPVLSQLGVLFLAAKAASSALGSALRLIGLNSTTSFLQADVGAKKLKLSIMETATAAKVLGSNIKAVFSNNLNDITVGANEISKLKTSLLGAAQGATALWSAWEMGHSFGTYLRENNEAVRDFGDGLGKAVAYVDAMFTDRTFDDVNQHFRTSAQLAKEQAAADKAAAEQAKIRAEAEKAQAAEQAAALANLQQKRQSLNAQIEANQRSLAVLTEAGKANGVIAQELTHKNQVLREELAKTNEQLGKQNAELANNSAFAAQKQALTDLGLTAEQVATGISQNAQAALDSFNTAAAQFGTSSESMARVFSAALQKMDSPEAVAKLKESLASVGTQAGLTADEIAQIGNIAPATADKVQAAFAKIGVDTQAIMSGISESAKQAMSDFASASEAAKAQGVNDARLIAAGFEQMMAELKSPEEFAAFQAQLTKSGDAAHLTSEQLSRLSTAARQGAIGAATAFDQLTQSVKQAGDTSSLQQLAQAAEAAMKRGEIAAVQYQQILQQVKERTAEITAQATADSQKQSEAVQKQAQAHQEVGKAAVQAASDVQTANEQTTQNINNATQRIDELGQKVAAVWRTMTNPSGHYTMAQAMSNVVRQASGEWAAFVQQMHKVRNEVNEVTTAMEAGDDGAIRLAQATDLAAQHANRLDKTTLNRLNAAIDNARQKMQALADEAAQARLNAEKELLQLQGKSEEVAEIEQQEKLKKLRDKQQKAAQNGNNSAVADYERAIQASEQAYQIQREQERQRQQEQQRQEQQRQEQERQRQQQEQQRQEQQRQRQQQEAAAREKTTQKQPATVSATLPAPSVNLGDFDLSGIAQQLNQRDKQLVEQVKSAILTELKQQMKARV